MATIQFDNGQKVQFDGNPTEKDIEEVAKKLGIVKEKSFARKVGDFFTSSTQKFAETLGTAASVIDPKTKKLREETISSTNKMVDDYISRAGKEKDKEKAKKYLEAAQKLADTEDIDIFNRPEYQKTAKQVIGEAAGTALETLSFGTFGKATAGMKSLQLGKATVPTIAKPILSPAKNILQGVKQGAGIGGVYGTAFGVAGAMEQNKSGVDILKEGLTGGLTGAAGGAVLGGAVSGLTGGVSALISRANKLSTEGKVALGKYAEKKLFQTSRELVKMSPTQTKNEAKWMKNTPEFIANEFVIDPDTLKPKSILQLIDSDGRRLVTDDAVIALRRKYQEESNAFNNLLKDSGEYVSLNTLRQRSIENIKGLKTQGADYDVAISQIEKEINAYKKNYQANGLVNGDDLLIRVDDFNKIKSGLWSKTSNFNPSQADKLQSDVSYKMGQTAKDLIEESVDDVAVKKMNQRLGDMASAIRVLENAQGKVIPGGFFGKQLTRIAGTVAGSTGGLPGSILGNITGGVLADVMLDPKVKTSVWTKLYQSLNKTKQGKTIIDEAIEILKKRGEERASRKLLEAPKYIPLNKKGDSSRLFSQEEAQQLLDSLKIKEPPKPLTAPLGDKTNPIILPKPKTKVEILKSTQKLDSLNPTGSVFAKYTPKQRATAELADNITTLDKTMGKSADDIITIYRGSNKGGEIVPGDFITTNKQLAKDYAGTGKVLEKKVKLSDVLDDTTEPLGEEYIYRPKYTPLKSSNNLINEAKKYNPKELIDANNAYVDRNIGVLKDNGINIKSPEQVITVYHGTGNKNIPSIEKNGFNEGSFFATDKNATRLFAGEKGKILEVKIPVSDLGFVFPGSMAGSKGVSIQSIGRLIKGKDGIYRIQ